MLLTVCLLCCFMLVWWVSRRLGSKSEPPSYPGGLPIIGHLHIALHPDNYYEELKAATAILQEPGWETITLRMGPMKLYVVTSPDDCLKVANVCLDKNYVNYFFKHWGGSGLFTANVDIWKRDRKLLFPAFSTSVINEFIPIFNEKSKTFVLAIGSQVGKGPFKPDRYIMDHSMSTTCATTLNFKTNTTLAEQYMHNTEELFDIITQRCQKIWLHTDIIYKCSSLWRKEKELVKMNTEIAKDAVLKRKLELLHTIKEDKMHNDSGKNKPLLDLLLQLKETQGIYTDDELIHQIGTGIVTSYDTLYKSFLFMLVVIGSHSNVQDRIYKELQDTFDDMTRDVDKDDLTKLVYLEAVIKETLRLYPISPYLIRNSPDKVQLEKYTIPANSHVIILSYALNRHPTWGPDANVYRPERWLELGGVPSNPNTLSIFGMGKRNCIGKRYAMMMMKTTLVHLLRQYRITGDVSKLKLKVHTMLEPVSGHEISLEMRQ